MAQSIKIVQGKKVIHINLLCKIRLLFKFYCCSNTRYGSATTEETSSFSLAWAHPLFFMCWLQGTESHTSYFVCMCMKKLPFPACTEPRPSIYCFSGLQECYLHSMLGNIILRPGLTDCGALGKIILGGPQIKERTKKKKKKGHSHFLQPFHTNQQYSYPNTAAK